MHMRHLETQPGRAQSQGFGTYPQAQGLDTGGPTQKRLGMGEGHSWSQVQPLFCIHRS